MSPGFIHVCTACVGIAFLFMVEQYSIVYLDHVLLIHSSMEGHMGCFDLLAVVSNAAVNVGVQISLQDAAFNSLGSIARSGIAGLYFYS